MKGHNLYDLLFVFHTNFDHRIVHEVQTLKLCDLYFIVKDYLRSMVL